MSSVPQGSRPFIGTRSTIVGFILAALLAFAYMATSAAGDASARDIYVSDSTTPLTGGFADESGGTGTATFTQGGSCATPNWTIYDSGNATSRADVQDALQNAFDPTTSGIATGDTVYFCNISAVAGTGTGPTQTGWAANTYAPAKGSGAFAVNLTNTPSGVTIGEAAGATVTLLANASGQGAGTEYTFFADNNPVRGVNALTVKDLSFTQNAVVDNDPLSGGAISINNTTTPGTLTLQNVSATGFSVQTGAGGVVAAENVAIDGMTLGTAKTNAADGTSTPGVAAESNAAVGGGGGVFAQGNITASGLNANNNRVLDGADGNGGALLAAGLNTGTGNVTLSGTASSFQKNQNLETGVAVPGQQGIGGAIGAAGVVSIDNASTFGGQPLTTNTLGGNTSVLGGGAVAGASVNVAPGVNFVNNSAAGGPGGAILAPGAQIGAPSGTPVKFLGNSAAGGGAVAIAGFFTTSSGVRFCAVETSITNTQFGDGTATSATNPGSNSASALGGGAVHVLPSATDTGPTGTPPTIKKCAVSLNGVDFNGNIAQTAGGGGAGGALFVGGGAVSANATTQFRNNDAGNTGTLAAPTWGNVDGGAIAVGNTTGAGASTELTLSVPASAFTANQAGGDGGAVSVASTTVDTSTISFTGSTFTSNNAANRTGANNDSGGAMSLADKVSISGATFTGNGVVSGAGLGTDTGGAVSLAGGDTTVTQSDFVSNNGGTDGSGGAVAVSAGSPSLTENTFTTNTAGTTSGNGGAMLVSGGGFPTVQENVFDRNTANGTTPGDGGAIAASTAFTESENEFLGNTATGDGGAIAGNGGDLTVSNSIFEGNYAGDDGGAVALAGASDLDAIEAAFVDNGALGDGGAVAVAAAVTDTVLDETAFIDNGAGVTSAGTFAAAPNQSDGGAVAIGGGTYLINDSVFLENGAAQDGGAVASAGNGSAAGFGIQDSGFALNGAGGANNALAAVGGAVSLSASAQRIVNSEFVANVAAQTNTNANSVTRGGGVAATGGALTINGSTFAANSVSSAAAVAPGGVAAAGGAVYMASALHNVTSTNSTFTQNSAPIAAVAWSELSGTLTFVSSTVAGNLAPAGTPILVSGNTAAGAIGFQNSVLAEDSANGSSCVTGTGGTVAKGVGGNVLTTTTDCGGTALVGGGGAPATKVSGADLRLGDLADNGGPTDTMALDLGSVAQASAANNLLGGGPVDQRGFNRPTTNQSSGAYQLTLSPTLTVSKAGAGQGTVVSNPAGIDCGPGCQTDTAEFALSGNTQTLVTLTATAASGSEFQSWSGPCVTVNGNLCVVNVNQANSITANFADNLRSLTVSRVGNGEGKVTSSPAGIDCGTTCQANYDLGTVVTLTAEASGQSGFVSWGGSCTGSSLTCQVTMDQARTVTAEFTQSPLVRIRKVTSGTIRVPSNRVISVGKVECVNGSCFIEQATARVKVRGRAFRANVRFNGDTFTTGQTRTVKVVVPKKARQLLRRKKSGNVTVVIRAQAEVPGSAIQERSRNLTNGLRR